MLTKVESVQRFIVGHGLQFQDKRLAVVTS